MNGKMLRMRRTLLLAVFLATSCATSTRVLVYNIHAGKDAGGKDNLERVAQLIRSTKADVVLLQEVDRNTTRSGYVDQVAVLQKLTGLHGAFGKSLDYQGGEYGIAALSRWPVTNKQIVPLRVEPPQVRAGGSVEPRVALIVETNGMRILNTHLDASREDRYRAQEVEQIIAIATSQDVLLSGGDFNSEPDSAVQQRLRGAGLRDSWTECGQGQALTYPQNEPVKRIDYLFLRGNARCSSARVLEDDASDHRAVLIGVTSSNSTTVYKP
jgi:endonuclease/exonuclease/phosphatase family metal-dependent hydrolase